MTLQSTHGPDPQAYVREILDVLGRLDRHEISREEAISKLRPCYCPEWRWEPWKRGIEAGADHMVGSSDDLDLPETAGET